MFGAGIVFARTLVLRVSLCGSPDPSNRVALAAVSAPFVAAAAAAQMTWPPVCPHPRTVACRSVSVWAVRDTVVTLHHSAGRWPPLTFSWMPPLVDGPPVTMPQPEPPDGGGWRVVCVECCSSGTCGSEYRRSRSDMYALIRMSSFSSMSATCFGERGSRRTAVGVCLTGVYCMRTNSPIVPPSRRARPD